MSSPKDSGAEFRLEPLTPGFRKLRELSLLLVEPRGLELERREVGLGEITVVVSVFLAAHRDGAVGVFVVEPRFLNDALARCASSDLPFDLVGKGAAEKPEGVDVLELDFGPELGRTHRTHGHIAVETEIAFFHVSVGHFGIFQDLFHRLRI